jgi:hypothetical protein
VAAAQAVNALFSSDGIENHTQRFFVGRLDAAVL